MAMTKLWTVEDVEQLPDDESRYALIQGVLHRMPPPGLPTWTRCHDGWLAPVWIRDEAQSWRCF